MTWKYKLAKVLGNSITGYLSGLGAVSLFDADLSVKLLNALFGTFIVAGIALGRLVSEYGDGKGKSK